MKRFQTIIRFDKKPDEKRLIIQGLVNSVTFPNPFAHREWHCAFLVDGASYEVVHVRRIE